MAFSYLALLHSIFFHRVFGNIQPLTRDILDVTFVPLLPPYSKQDTYLVAIHRWSRSGISNRLQSNCLPTLHRVRSKIRTRQHDNHPRRRNHKIPTLNPLFWKSHKESKLVGIPSRRKWSMLGKMGIKLCLFTSISSTTEHKYTQCREDWETNIDGTTIGFGVAKSG